MFSASRFDKRILDFTVICIIDSGHQGFEASIQKLVPIPGKNEIADFQGMNVLLAKVGIFVVPPDANSKTKPNVICSLPDPK